MHRAEAIHHNPIVFDLISRLAWNPSTVEMSAFLEDYAVRRYGAAAAPGMVRCFRELTASVYGAPGVGCPLYIAARHRRAAPRGEALWRRPGATIPAHLQAALEIALAESDHVGDRALWNAT